MSISIFDQFGKIRDLSGDDDVAAIEALPDDHRAKLFDCIASCHARDAGEERSFAARREARTKEAALQEAVSAQSEPLRDSVSGDLHTGPRAEAATNPAAQNAARVAAARAVAAAQKPGYVSPKAKPNKSKVAIDKAQAELAEARAELVRSTTEFRRLERLAGEAINAFRGCLPKVTRDSLMKDHVAAGQAERQRRVDAGLAADTPRVEPQYQSELDRQRGTARYKPRPLIRPR